MAPMTVVSWSSETWAEPPASSIRLTMWRTSSPLAEARMTIIISGEPVPGGSVPHASIVRYERPPRRANTAAASSSAGERGRNSVAAPTPARRPGS